MTLYVKGIVITGSLVAYGQFSKHITQTMLPEVNKNNGAETEKMVETIINNLNMVIETSELKDLRDYHVCIKHPTIYLPQGPYSFRVFGLESWNLLMAFP
jgi:hypothetical protein